MIRHLLVPTLAAALCAGEATPTFTLGLADGAQLIEHWQATPYAKVWNDPGLAVARTAWDGQKATWKTEHGLDVDAVLAAMRGLRFEMGDIDMKQGPPLRLRVDLGDQAQAVFDLIARVMPQEATVAGADAARSAAAATLARFGTTLVFAMRLPVEAVPAKPQTTDLALSLDYARMFGGMLAAMPDAQRAEMQRMQQFMAETVGIITWQTALIPQGLHEVMVQSRVPEGLLPADRGLLDRFPANTLAAAAAGINLAPVWKTIGPFYLDMIDQAMHGGSKQGREVTTTEVNAILAGLGVAGGIDQLAAEVKGTIAVAVTPSVPFPAVSIVVPRSPAIDALVAHGMQMLGAQAPAEGASGILPIPKLPLLITVARDRTTWLVTSDAMLVQSWLSGKPGGFLGSPSAKALLAAAPQTATALGAIDTQAALRTAIPFITMGLSAVPQMPNEVRQAILAGTTRFAVESGPSWAWSAPEGTGLRTEAKGPLGAGVVPIAAIAAGIAVPNLLESRVAANEAATAASLKSGIFPAQIQFQAGGYQDADGDNVGEYGTLAELTGRHKTGKTPAGAIKLVVGPLATGNVANGYNFRMYLPDATGGAVSSDDAERAADAGAANAQEQHFLVVAWPESTKTGRRMFALGSDGQVRSRIFDGIPPEFSDVLPQGWGTDYAWEVHERSGRGNRRNRAPVEDAPVSDGQGMF